MDVGVGEAELQVVVTDDGVGGARANDGGGIAGMSRRVRDLGGEFAFRSEPGNGTTIRALIPRVVG